MVTECYICGGEYKLSRAEKDRLGEGIFDPTDYICPYCKEGIALAEEAMREEGLQAEWDYGFQAAKLRAIQIVKRMARGQEDTTLLQMVAHRLEEGL